MNSQKIEISLLVAMALGMAAWIAISELRTNPGDVLDRVDRLEKKLEIVPADVLRELQKLRAELELE